MSLQIIEAIRHEAKISSAETNRLAINGKAANILRVANALNPTQKPYSRKFISRQTQTIDADGIDRWNIFGRFKWMSASIAFGNPRGFDEIYKPAVEHFLQALPEMREGLDKHFRPRLFFDVQFELNVEMSRLPKIFLSGDRLELRRSAARLRGLIIEMEESAGEQMQRSQ